MVFFGVDGLKDSPMVVGHRGWPTRFPDNTLAGFLAAASVADAVELDVRRSSDGKLVLSHDPSIGGFEVSSHPWRILGEVDLGDGHRPALLDEVVSGVPGLPIQFEIKNLPNEPGFEPDHRLALEAAERARPGDFVTSFNWESLAAVRRMFPDVATGVLVGGSGDIDRAINECLDIGHPALVPSIDLPTLGLVHALEAGLQIFSWTVNDPDRADELASLGVTGIITDDPALVRGVVGRNP
jgi:glycerophosphoryl diester phosphodiesterase